MFYTQAGAVVSKLGGREDGLALAARKDVVQSVSASILRVEPMTDEEKPENATNLDEES